MSGDSLRQVEYDDIEFDDQLALYRDCPFSGVIFATFSNGKMEIEFNYLDGLPSGIQRRWYEDGNIEEEWNAIRGQGSEWYRTWYRNGQLKCERIEKNFRPNRIREWSEDGVLIKDEKFDE